jgi:hypothetical protein
MEMQNCDVQLEVMMGGWVVDNNRSRVDDDRWGYCAVAVAAASPAMTLEGWLPSQNDYCTSVPSYISGGEPSRFVTTARCLSRNAVVAAGGRRAFFIRV